MGFIKRDVGGHGTSLQQKRVYTSLGSSCPTCVHQSWEEYQRIVLANMSKPYSEYFPCFVMDFGVRMLDRKDLNWCTPFFAVSQWVMKDSIILQVGVHTLFR